MSLRGKRLKDYRKMFLKIQLPLLSLGLQHKQDVEILIWFSSRKGGSSLL
jgi:hypothetical protein